MKDTLLRLLWEPAVYEHKAALIGKSPGEVSRSAALLAKALEAEFLTYRADFLTVGIDVYNLEAEAVGATLVEGDSRSCPDIRVPPFSIESFHAPELPNKGSGRFGMVIEAAHSARKTVDTEAVVRIAASGPVSVASKLVGLEELIVSLASESKKAEFVLDFCEALCGRWLSLIRGSGFDAVLFDSAAAPPMLSPPMYAQFVLPRHRRLIGLLRSLGQREFPLIVGGNTVPIVGTLVGAGATTLICDFTADAGAFAAAMRADAGVRRSVRRNIDPSLFIPTGRDPEGCVTGYIDDLRCFGRPIAGTGILPYDTDPDRFLRFRSEVDRRWTLRSE